MVYYFFVCGWDLKEWDVVGDIVDFDLDVVLVFFDVKVKDEFFVKVGCYGGFGDGVVDGVCEGVKEGYGDGVLVYKECGVGFEGG